MAVSKECLDNIYLKIFERAKYYPLGVLGVAAKLGYEQKEYRITYFKELKQQIASCRGNMTEIFGEEIINEIDNLDIKVRKLKRLSIFKNQPDMAEY
jgi:hypothetical protein